MNLLVTSWFLLTLTTATVFARIIIIRHADSNHYPRYAYKYSVHDPKTKDHKEHWETRNGDLVKGAYSLVEPDGKLRVVDYWADDANGFNADVKRLGPHEHLPTIPAKPASVAEDIEDASPKPENADPPEPVAEAPEPESVGVSDHVLKPLVLSTKYGFGSGADDPPLGQPYASAIGTGSLQWDPKTSSYGGWVPLNPRDLKYATIFTKKYIDGKLHEWAIGPISLVGRTLVFKVKH